MDHPVTLETWREMSDHMIEAAGAGFFATVRQLLNNGACVNRRDFLGRTAFMYAAHWGDVHALRDLSARPGLRGHDFIHDMDENEWRPLHFAAAGGNVAAVKWLLGMRADYSLFSLDMRTALDVALEHNWLDVAKLISEHAVRNAKRTQRSEAEQWRAPQLGFYDTGPPSYDDPDPEDTASAATQEA
jgi:ankyrin repeat protein